MLRVRNLVLAIAAATALTSNTVFALGVGEVRLQSALNQPLVAEIELADTKGLSTSEIKTRLASAEDFKRLGINRPHFLNDLKFTAVQRPDGRHAIRVTSSKPVREPYLSFLVDVQWPSGRLVREYTLLFDPPLYSPEAVSQSAPHLPGSKATPLNAPPTQAAAAPQPQPAQPQPAAKQGGGSSPQAAGNGGAGEYRVANRDTLWGISEKVREVGTVHQNMAAIWDLNPEAFVGGNINRMQTGQVLRLPTAEDVNKRSHPEAVAQVAQQTTRWRRNGEQQNAPAEVKRSGPAPSAQPAEDAGDNLRLVAAGQENQVPAAASTASKTKAPAHKSNAEVQALRDELANTRESLDSSRRESNELKERLDDLQSQLDKLTRLMHLKDNQLVELQGRLSQPQEPAAEAIPIPQVAEQPITATPVAPKIPLAEEPSTTDDLLNFMLANAVMLGSVGGGVLLALLLALLLLRRKKASKDKAVAVADKKAPPVTANRRRGAPLALDEHADDLSDDVPLKMVAPKPRQETAASGVAEDLAKADIYLAYGHFPDAIQLLQKTVDADPYNPEPRLKLMEAYAGAGDRELFISEEAALREIGVPEARLRLLRDKYPAMAVQIPRGAGDNTMGGLDFDALLDESAHPSDYSPRSEPIRASNNRPIYDFDSDLDASPASSAKAKDNDPFDGFDWDLPEEGSPAASAKADSKKTPDFSLDDLDDFAEPAPSPASTTKSQPAPAKTMNDPLADFDLSLDVDEVAPEPKPEPAAAPKRTSAPAKEEEPAGLAAVGDETATKLDLAKAYIEMGDKEGAKDILSEVIAEGNDRQKRAARKLLNSLG